MSAAASAYGTIICGITDAKTGSSNDLGTARANAGTLTGRASNDLRLYAESAKPPVSGRDVLPVIERQGAHAGGQAAGRHAVPAAPGRARSKPTARAVRHAITHSHRAGVVVRRARNRPSASAARGARRPGFRCGATGA